MSGGGPGSSSILMGMTTGSGRLFFLLSICAFLFACGRSPQPPVAPPPTLEEAETLGKMTRDATLIAFAQVETVDSWKDRKDWKIVTLKLEKVLKGNAPKKISLLDVKLFPGEADRFAPGEKALVFLRALPAYTAWRDVILSGVGYSLLGKSKGLIEEGKEEIAHFVELFPKLPPASPEMREFILKTLERNGTERLREDLSREIFDRDLFPFELRDEDLVRLGALVKQEDFPETGKKELVIGMAALPGDTSSRLLRDFFCLSPPSVCLKSAETLETRGQPISLEDYTRALSSASPGLRAGLLAILGRHHRVEALPLFEKYLKEEKGERNAAAMMEALGDLGDPKAVGLALSYADDPRYYLRAAVVVALGKLKSEEGIPALEKALKTSDPSLVALAAQALQRIGTTKAIQALSRHFEKGHHGHWEPTEGPQHFLPEAPKNPPPTP